MTPEEALQYIHSYLWRGSRPGLSRTAALLARMGEPQKKLKFIHIVGTNGKGSTAAMLASVLRQAGYTTGLYTSPYLIRFHERMQVGGVPITDGELAQITAFVQPLAEEMDEHPTEFELVTAIAMEFFLRRHCQIVVLEAGMGGALDSTNVIDAPEAAVFTNIGLDHMEYLGSTVEQIARTKAGILKPGTTAVCYRAGASVEAVYEAICREKGIELHKADFSSLVPRSHSLDGQIFDFGSRRALFLPLLGAHQLCNAAVALTTLDVLRGRGWRIPEEAIRDGLRLVRWPGRFEVLCRAPLFLADGGHNPQCAQALAQNVRDYLPGKKLTVLTGVLADKDYPQMFTPLLPYTAGFVTLTPPNPRALSAAALADYLRTLGKPATPAQTISEGVRLACALAGADGAVLAFGSLYMIGALLALVEEHGDGSDFWAELQ